jgi:glycosyltransferase involved in cell wall biosynthesis
LRRKETTLVLNLFYEEPDEDRWLPFDRLPRRIARRVLRGNPVIGGHKRVFLNLRAGLDRLGVRYRINDYDHARRNPDELVCIVGKAHVLDKMKWRNPILFGAAVFSHPLDDPRLFERLPVRKVLVPGAWMKEMWRPHWDEPIAVWPVGIDTDRWRPADAEQKRFDVLLYDKVRWDHAHYEAALIEPIRRKLRYSGRTFRDIRYGFYREEQFQAALAECRAMIFLCEHETQGIAYQQALAAGVPILAWDRGGYWQDPAYFPDKVKFQPVSSVPYWDARCGRTFAAIEAFDDAWDRFCDEARSGRLGPRRYILENLTLEQCARQYMQHVRDVSGD